MSDRSRKFDESRPLIDAAMNGTITAEQAADLQSLLEDDLGACELYAEYSRIEAELHLMVRGRMANQAVRREIGFPPAAVESAYDDADVEFITPALTDTESGFSGGPWRGAISVFSQTGPLSYLIATVVLAAMLLGAWAYKISHDTQIAVPSVPKAVEDLRTEYAARVTGVKDCRLAGGESPIYLGSPAVLGRKYSLASGLLELTYRDGARVILEGPCEYTVDSRAGGFLRVGKLVARVEKKVASGQWPVARKGERVASGEWRVERKVSGDGLAASAASEKLLATGHWPLATNPESPAPSPQPLLSTLHSPLFTITTPTAVVTDLGTEFGVEVDGDGNTISHVFEGIVNVQSNSDLGNSPKETSLRAGQTVICSKGEKIKVFLESPQRDRFVRRIGFDPTISERIVESFDGDKLDPRLEQMPPGRFANIAGAAEYCNPPANEGRGYIRTCKTDFCDRDFVFETTVNIGLEKLDTENVARQVFIGIGDGVPNPDYFDTVTCGLTFSYIVDTGMLNTVFRRPKTTNTYNENNIISQLATGIEPGRHRIRMWKRGNRVGFDIDTNFTGKFSVDYSTRAMILNQVTSGLNNTNSRLFIGSGYCAKGIIRFEDISISFSETKGSCPVENPRAN